MPDLWTLAQEEAQRDLLLRLLNVSSYALIPWVVLGLAGQLAFFCRMAIQWIISERERRSVVPTVYWWFSIGGSMMLLTYFIWRQDIVGILGQSMGSIVYIRNLRLIHKRAKAEHRAPTPTDDLCPLGAPECPRHNVEISVSDRHSTDQLEQLDVGVRPPSARRALAGDHDARSTDE